MHIKYYENLEERDDVHLGTSWILSRKRLERVAAF